MMNYEEKATIAEELGKLAIAFGKEFSELRCMIYTEQLADLPILNVLHAIHQSMKTETFFPSIAALRREAGEGGAHLADRALEAWYSLRRLTGRRSFNSQALEDPIIEKCFLRMGGVTTFGAWDYLKEEDFKRKEFCDMYQALTRRHDQQALPASEAMEALDCGFPFITREIIDSTHSQNHASKARNPAQYQKNSGTTFYPSGKPVILICLFRLHRPSDGASLLHFSIPIEYPLNSQNSSYSPHPESAHRLIQIAPAFDQGHPGLLRQKCRTNPSRNRLQNHNRVSSISVDFVGYV